MDHSAERRFIAAFLRRERRGRCSVRTPFMILGESFAVVFAEAMKGGRENIC